eukprot:2554600-Amphidinium_carterae.1
MVPACVGGARSMTSSTYARHLHDVDGGSTRAVSVINCAWTCARVRQKHSDEKGSPWGMPLFEGSNSTTPDE